jgi:threonine dehydrogenase-like Zn-dependent dehydrogenase
MRRVRAVVLDANGQPGLVELPEPTGDGTRVRVLACGLCGSDVEKLGDPSFAGAVLGHEIAGVTDDGTRVTVMHRVPCGECVRCRAGNESTCEDFARPRIAPGGFAEHLRATHTLAIGDANGVWLEPLACVLRAADHVPRGRVLVVGAGAIGQLWIQVLLRRGDAVFVAEPRADRLASAERLGASVDSGTVGAAVLTAHGGAADALARLEPGGSLVVFAAAPAGVPPLPLDLIYRRELRLVGSRSATPAQFEAALELLPSLALPEATTLPLDRFAEGVELYRRGEALKVVFTP